MTSMQHYKRSKSIDRDSVIGDNVATIKPSNQNGEIIKQIRHTKCKVIRLTREQMQRFKERQAEVEARIQAANTIWNGIRKRGHLIVVSAIVGILVWMSLVYGALLGATVCSSGRSGFPFVSFHATQVKHSLF